MSYRAAIVLLQDDKIALIERQRAGMHYFTFPGGHVERGEAPEAAAVREAREELGLDVAILRLVAQIWWNGLPQYHYLVEVVGGEFGTGTGEEMLHDHPEKGSYRPVWVPLGKLLTLPVLPRPMAELTVKALLTGWPDPAPVLDDEA
jgi:8-oxo-dGTP diphosphatase